MEQINLDLDCCRERQRWMVETIRELEADRAFLCRPEHVQYLTGFRPHKLMTAVVCIELDGRCILSAPNKAPDHVAADEVVTFEAQWHSTLRQDQMRACAKALGEVVANQPTPNAVAVESSAFPTHLLHVAKSGTLIDIEPRLWKRRRRKDPDEMKMIRRAIACTEAMYARARAIITPGISEIEVFNQLHAAAVEVAGEPLTDIGNDYRCAARGGPPRGGESAQSGDLFILDLGPAYRGYYADNCRTFSVDGNVTDAQAQAWEAIVDCLRFVQETVKPGKSSRELFEEVQTKLDEYREGWFPHHLGHGIGLYPHEAPHLNPNWDDTFEEGDVFTAEPGLYDASLCAGIRLEENYRVTAEGVEKLTAFPLDLA